MANPLLEKAKPANFYIYKRHRFFLKKLKRHLRAPSEGHIVRAAIEEYAERHPWASK